MIWMSYAEIPQLAQCFLIPFTGGMTETNQHGLITSAHLLIVSGRGERFFEARISEPNLSCRVRLR